MTHSTPTPRRPVRPWLAARAFVHVLVDPEDTRNGARFVLALEGSRGERNFQRFRRDPVGARILAERRSLLDRLRDRGALAALPPESLGAAYLRFVDEQAVSAEGLAQAVAGVEEELGWQDRDRVLFSRRVRDMHDLWHVVTGYSRDLAGELALLAFGYEQLGTRAYRLLLALNALAPERRAPGMKALARDARVRGRRACWLPAQDWEALLEQPLDAVRELLWLGPAPTYTRYVRDPRGFGLVPEASLAG